MTPKPYIRQEDLVSAERRVIPAAREGQATEAMLRRIGDVAVYGLLLTPSTDDVLSRVVRARWSELHHRSGGKVLLVAFTPPDAWPDALVDSWRKELGDDFESLWADWERGYGLEGGAALEYLGFTSEPKIDAKDLPCVVVFTDLQDRRAVVRRLPEWSEKDLYDLLCALVDVMVAGADVAPEHRLEWLRDELTSPGARARATLGHLFDKTHEFLRRHPAVVASTAISLVVALATANVLPLSASALAALKEARGALKG